jgi:hypothetical protein
MSSMRPIKTINDALNFLINETRAGDQFSSKITLTQRKSPLLKKLALCIPEIAGLDRMETRMAEMRLISAG